MGNCIAVKLKKPTRSTKRKMTLRESRSNRPKQSKQSNQSNRVTQSNRSNICLKSKINANNTPTTPTIHLPSSVDKKAVLIGLNYTGTSAALQGCINDAMRMAKTLQTKFDYKDTTVFTDRDLSRRNNILQVLDRLIDSKVKNLYFQYSGHGTQVYDHNNDEADGLDEALYSVGGTLITDDEINKRVQRIPNGTNMVLVIDACHSGTMIDLPYQLKNGKVVKINNNEVRGDVICISGCRDNQVSMDVNAENTSYGAMSNALQKVLTRVDVNTITWKALVTELNAELRKDHYAQVPQLCVSRPDLINQIVKF